MEIRFYKTRELKSSSSAKIHLRSNALINIKNFDKYCFIWSTLASLHLCDNDHPIRVPNYIQHFHELNIECFDFTNGFKCRDMYRYEKVKILSIIIYEINFYQDDDKWKHTLLPIEISKNDSDRFVDLIFYKITMLTLKNYMYFFGKLQQKFCMWTTFKYLLKGKHNKKS